MPCHRIPLWRRHNGVFFSPYFSCTRPHGRLSVYARENATPLTFDNTELKQRRRWRQRERQKSNRFILAKQQLCPCIKLFCTFLCRHCTTSISTDWYQSNQIYRFLLIYRLKNQYRFLSIDYSGLNRCYIFTSHSFIRELKQQRRRRLRKRHLRSGVAMR